MVYVIGGREGSSDEFHAFDPSANEWTSLIDMPTKRDGLIATIVGDYFYAITGAVPTMGGILYDINESIDYQTNTRIESSNDNYGNIDFRLYPNPAKTETRIYVNIPENVKQASILIQDIRGRIYKKIEITDIGDCNLSVGGLSEGINFCSLIINGAVVETKRLIVSY